MSTQSKTMPLIDLKVYIRVVAAVFSISSATAIVMTLLRVLNPQLYYLDALNNRDMATAGHFTHVQIGHSKVMDYRTIHYFVSGFMLLTSTIGFLNSLIVINRSATQNTGRNITIWLLLDSLFETSRVVYVFLCEIILKGKGPLQFYELLITIIQYLLDSFLYCQMILRH
ncbi:uncharacterized protein LOC111000804 [Pieris rapae]|uniref:uncharacterized protein LOC111000804 n=1 Tax=Pieris rapae TaxID=64459 RepID=UPI000B926D5B|nr:uncharacterized protein LOC111000804 [Pieris rapae]